MLQVSDKNRHDNSNNNYQNDDVGKSSYCENAKNRKDPQKK